MTYGPSYFTSVRKYGTGFGINPSDFNDAYLPASGAAADFLEITAPSTRHRGPAAYADFQRPSHPGQRGFTRRGIADLSGEIPVLVHSTNVNPAYPDPPADEDLAALRQLAELSSSPWVTEDLGVWLMNERHVYPFFMPLPLTRETLAVCVDNVARVQDALGRPFNAEIPPMTYVVGDMNAFEFFARLCELTGCGMCVDVGHVLSYQLARGCSPTADFHRIPWPHVTEIHVAGGGIDMLSEGFAYQDDHGDREIVSVCLDLVDEVIENAPNLRAIVLELFGAQQPAAAIRRLRRIRARPAVSSWLRDEDPKTGLPPLEVSREQARTASVQLYDLLHSDIPLSGQRLHDAGPQVLDAFATAERRRWDYDRQSRLTLVGSSLVTYYPVTSSWLRLQAGWTAEELYGRLIANLTGAVPFGLDVVTRTVGAVLREAGACGHLQELFRCETWMNDSVAGQAVNEAEPFGIDIERCAKEARQDQPALARAARKVNMIYRGEGRFTRQGRGAQDQSQNGPEPPLADQQAVVCGTARCCSGD
jgi:uncharacterized protein (UPF0276 family)